MDRLLVCRCGEVVIRSVDGVAKMRGKVTVFQKGQAYVVCKGCGAELNVPITLNQEELLIKSRTPKLFLKQT
jgi:ribosomal protein S27E